MGNGMSFKLFLDFIGETSHPISAEPGELEQLKGQYPDEVLELWGRIGWSGFLDGFLWSVNPLTSREGVMAEWNGSLAPRVTAFMRTAFGSMMVYDGQNIFELDVHNGLLRPWSKAFPFFLNNFFALPQFMNGSLHHDVYKNHLPELGPVGPDEVYALVPALPLGGSWETSKVEKAKMREHLAILAQCVGPLEMV